MSTPSSDLIKHFSELLHHVTGEANFIEVCGYESVSKDALVCVADEKMLTSEVINNASVVVADTAVIDSLTEFNGAIFSTENVRLAQALVKQHYNDYDHLDSEWADIHESAVVHPSADIGKKVRVGPNTVIGENCQIGANTVIRANCVIEHEAIIGDDCVVHPMVNLGYRCVIGNRVNIQPGTIIGSEGYGFAADENKHNHRIPHTGNVVIADDVQIGSQCNVDRATYGSTCIGRGTKIDAQCHIAHNVEVGEDCLLTAQVCIAGSSKIGDRVIASGQTGVLDHKTIADDVILVHRCGVTSDITEPGMWAGTPAQPWRDYVKNSNAPKKLARLEAKLKTIESKD